MVETLKRLAEPFDPREVQVKLQSISKDRSKGQVVAYVDARTVIKRLNEVLGPAWEDQYAILSDQTTEAGRVVEVRCILRLDLGGTKVQREDVGEGDSLKAAFSDALKRAAVKFGIGLYLYELPKVWVDLDQNGRFNEAEARRRMGLSADGQTAPASPSPSAPAPQPQAQPSGGKATQKQIAAIFALSRKANVPKEELSDLVSGVAGREVKSLDELTIEEASAVIDFLQADGKMPF